MKAMQLLRPYSSTRNGLLICDRKMFRLIRPIGWFCSTTGRLTRSRCRLKTSITFSFVSSVVMHGTSVQRSAALGWRKRGRKSLKYSEVSGMENGACWIDVYLCYVFNVSYL